MKILIIEDEAPAYRRLIKLISECDSSVEVIGVIQTVKEGMEWFQKNAAPDVPCFGQIIVLRIECRRNCS